MVVADCVCCFEFSFGTVDVLVLRVYGCELNAKFVVEFGVKLPC
jgi:hypothetical protein